MDEVVQGTVHGSDELAHEISKWLDEVLTETIKAKCKGGIDLCIRYNPKEERTPWAVQFHNTLGYTDFAVNDPAAACALLMAGEGLLPNPEDMHEYGVKGQASMRITRGWEENPERHKRDNLFKVGGRQ